MFSLYILVGLDSGVGGTGVRHGLCMAASQGSCLGPLSFWLLQHGGQKIKPVILIRKVYKKNSSYVHDNIRLKKGEIKTKVFGVKYKVSYLKCPLVLDADGLKKLFC